MAPRERAEEIFYRKLGLHTAIQSEDFIEQCLNVIATVIAEAQREAVEKCAKVTENIYGGMAHTYGSENADRYRAQDETCKRIANEIRKLKID
jgi:hypothetical protein